MHEDPQIDLQDAAEFFRRGDDGDYAEAESLPPTGTALCEEGEGENERIDPAILGQRVERRARFTHWVKTGMVALTLATVLAFGVRALSRSSVDSVPVNISDGAVLAARAQPSRVVEAPAQKIESARPEQAPPAADATTPRLAAAKSTAPPPTEAQDTASTRASRSRLVAMSASPAPKGAIAKGVRASAQRAIVAPVEKLAGNSALPAVTITKGQTESTQGAIRPPTARFAD